MRPTPYVASLRVYEPLSAFEPVDRLRWSQLEVTDSTSRDEQNLALQRIIFPGISTLRPDGAYILEIDGARYVSPWSTATRCWAALEDFKSSLPAPVSMFFLPQSLDDGITTGAEYAENRVPHILTQTWLIPPRWFSLFVPEERVRGRDAQGVFTRVRTSIANAKARCVMVHTAVRQAFGVGPVEEEIAELTDWLDMFHPKSFVELDYGGLAGYLENSLINEGGEGLNADTSIEDVLSSIAGLATGDGALAGEGYERLVTRWRKVAAFEQAM